jgi:hypothetical protein
VEFPVEVGEPPAEADGDASQARPALALPLAQPLAKRGLGGLGDPRWHRAIFLNPPAACPCRIGSLLGQPVGLAGWEGGMVARGGGRSPFAVTLTASQRRFLKTLLRRPTAQQRQVTRARIVLLAAA